MRHLTQLFVLLAIPLAAFSQGSAPQPTTRQVGTATLQNVPAVPADVSAAVQRYQNYRAAVFQDLDAGDVQAHRAARQRRQDHAPDAGVVFADEGHGFLKKHNNDLRREVATVFLAKLFAK